jgi:lysophospholipase L1-like esterase
MIQSTALFGLIPVINSMQHLVLLGDSIFDNVSYTGGKPDVITQVRERLPPEWRATLAAVDGATTQDIFSQLSRLPEDTTHLVLSIGGNDALRRQQILDMPVRSSADTFMVLAKAVQEFETAYRKVITACLKKRLPLVLCTIYNGNFPDLHYRQRVAVALAAFNDVIIRVATESRLPVIELRLVCNQPEDYANPIEPSHIGGSKIAKVIVSEVTSGKKGDRGAVIIGL